MLFKRFSIQVILRILLLLGSIFTLTFILGNKDFFFNQIILSIVITLQVWELIRYVNKVNQELAKFLEAIRHQDFTVSFNQKALGSSFQALEEAFSMIIRSYEQVKIEKEAQFHFLEAIVRYLDIGIITTKNNQEIILMNEAAEKLLQVPRLKNWEHLKKKNPAFGQVIESLSPSGKRLLEIYVQDEAKRLSVNVSPLALLEEHYEIITLQDINSEIEQKEIEAWNKLIRTLTHEIMNSLTPVSSLTETMIYLLETPEGNLKSTAEIEEETLEDVRFSLKTIQSRNEGMLAFLESYRKVARIPTPQMDTVNVQSLFDNIRLLMQAELLKSDISFSTNIYADYSEVLADQKLIEQVLINLLTNAIQALESTPNPTIQLLAKKDSMHRLLIEVCDNGPGIEEKKLDKIFIPFYSTKESGSGIGLSLSRNIMNLHKGSLQVQSKPNSQTVFTLIFPKQIG